MGDIIDIDEYIKGLTDEEMVKIIEYAASHIPSGKTTKNDLLSRIAECYLIIMKALKINEYNDFRFIDKEYNRLIFVEGKEYDLDGIFTGDESQEAEEAEGCLYEIDALMGDLIEGYGGMTEEKIFKNVQKIILKK